MAAPLLVYYLVVRDRTGPEGGGAAAVRSIAVLPFADMSPGKDQEYFADGIAEEILDALVHVDGLRVSGRTSSFSFKNKAATIAQIGRELNVATVLEGSVRKDGNRVRITAQLVDVGRGDHVWSHTYDRELTGIFAVQEEIARSVVAALRVKIMPEAGSGMTRQRTTNPEAYSAYLLGRHFFDRGTPDGMGQAVAALEKAIALDPGYAPAWAWLSVAILNSGVYFSQGASPAAIDQAAQRAMAAAEKAVTLAPNLADCWSARAWMRISISWDWDGAGADLQRALALNPRDPNILLRQSHLQALIGKLPDAIATARKVVDIDPLYAWAWVFLAGFENGNARPALTLAAATRALEIAPEHTYANSYMATAQLLSKMPAEALATYQRNRSEVIRLAGSAAAQHDLGNLEEGQKALDLLRARSGDSELYLIGRIHAWRGDRDAAFEWLDRAVVQHGGGGVSRMAIRGIRYDPLLWKVHDDPRYAALLRRMNLPVE